MPAVWASSAFAGGDDTFRTLHQGLSVSLISTSRDQLRTCRPTELASDVLAANSGEFDFIPVIDNSDSHHGFVGLFPAAAVRNSGRIDGTVASLYQPLADELLIHSDVSILDYVLQADSRPCCLLIEDSQIVGLVTLSDLQRLPVRAALFALITGFEMTMADFIKARLPDEAAWMAMLRRERQEKLRREISTARTGGAFIDALLFTQFSDKAQILKQLDLGLDPNLLTQQLEDFRNLRNSLAHANEYASSPHKAKQVCKLVRNLLSVRLQLNKELAQ
ncbi:hypothetical protein JQ574_17460 [Bradyrhizobium sp. AUGA SZCCT0158]|uniref:hypothetical protein n=1 Tax=Bradyrhizobium sp. AUGA SZCCT0158 TaxID=2807661 RepID=UPI001BACFC37|nr:hypothetical protein [Bradyrhizobium sp. AUGA SZCCT0158]MBR1197786.1 hypothetical protein [Bradyrhizobium sp. AUGA SZCCT0158]